MSAAVWQMCGALSVPYTTQFCSVHCTLCQPVTCAAVGLSGDWCILTLHARLTPHCSRQESVCVLVTRGVIPQGRFVDHTPEMGRVYTGTLCRDGITADKAGSSQQRPLSCGIPHCSGSVCLTQYWQWTNGQFCVCMYLHTGRDMRMYVGQG